MAVTLAGNMGRAVIYFGETDTYQYFCRSCSTNYCDSAFTYNIYTSASGGPWSPSAGQLAYSKELSQVCIGPQNVQILWDAYETIGNSFVVTAYDGSGSATTLLNTGCVTGSGSTTATIPAGTVKLVVQINSACNTTGNDLWSFLMQCV